MNSPSVNPDQLASEADLDLHAFRNRIKADNICRISEKACKAMTRPRGYKTFSMLNSAEHEIYPAHKC